jgi:hypothetical protein
MALPRTRNLQQLPPTRRGPPHAASTASLSAMAARWVHVDDAELVRRLQRVRARRERLESADLASGCWKWECNKKGFSVYSRRRGSATGGGDCDRSSTSNNNSNNNTDDEEDERCVGEVVATGTVEASVDKLATVFRSANESDYNVRMKTLYKAQFIYGSLVHVVAFPDRLSRPADAGDNSGSSRSNNSRSNASSGTLTADGVTQVSVKTCAFAKPRSLSLLGSRNEQWCLVEQFRRTARGFALEFSSLDASEISLGKARPGCVDELLPVSGWLLVEQAAPNLPLRVVFRARIDSRTPLSRLTRSASPKTTLARLIELGKGLSRLDDAGVTRPAAALTDKSHSNSHCISCTARLRLTARLAGRQRQCQLCFYAACADCCRREQLMIYNRYSAALDVCHRCKESMQGGEYSHVQLLAAKRHGSHGSLSLRPSAGASAFVDGRTLSAVNV